MNDIDFKLLNYVYKQMQLTPTQRRKIADYLGKDTEAHRVIRGNAGGKYVLSNIMWLPKWKHRQLHEGEQMGRKG